MAIARNVLLLRQLSHCNLTSVIFPLNGAQTVLCTNCSFRFWWWQETKKSLPALTRVTRRSWTTLEHGSPRRSWSWLSPNSSTEGYSSASPCMSPTPLSRKA